RNDRYPCGHCLQNLQPCAAADPERDDSRNSLSVVWADIRYGSRDLDASDLPKPAHLGAGPPADNGENQGRFLSIDAWPHLPGEANHGVPVGPIIHRPDEENSVRIQARIATVIDGAGKRGAFTYTRA